VLIRPFSFGVPAVLLELIPVLGIFFAFTNTVGAALWASDMEQNGTTAPNLRNQAELAKKAE
jgi:predicted PurR-regulated permease PerM